MAKKRIQAEDAAALSKPADVAAAQVATQAMAAGHEVPIITGGGPAADPAWGEPIRVIVRDLQNPNAQYMMPVNISTRRRAWTGMVPVNRPTTLPANIAKSMTVSGKIVHEIPIPSESGLYELSYAEAQAVDEKQNPGTRLTANSFGQLVRIREVPRFEVVRTLD